MTGSWSMGPRGEGAKSERILVLGAGMAGLVAARLLHDSGFKVTLLEARERIGEMAYAYFTRHAPRGLWLSEPSEVILRPP